MEDFLTHRELRNESYVPDFTSDEEGAVYSPQDFIDSFVEHLQTVQRSGRTLACVHNHSQQRFEFYSRSTDDTNREVYTQSIEIPSDFWDNPRV